jgi:hypothetical protein
MKHFHNSCFTQHTAQTTYLSVFQRAPAQNLHRLLDRLYRGVCAAVGPEVVSRRHVDEIEHTLRAQHLCGGKDSGESGGNELRARQSHVTQTLLETASHCHCTEEFNR